MSDGFVIEDGILTNYTLRESVVVVPEGVHTIGKSAFKGYSSIEQVVLPETVQCISEDAFKGCRKLKKINFPSNLTYIGQ